MLRSEVGGTDWPDWTRGVTKTFRLSTVPVWGPDILQVHRSHKEAGTDVGNIPHKNTHFTDIYGVL